MDEQSVSMLILVAIVTVLANVAVNKVRDWYRARHSVQEEPEYSPEPVSRTMSPPPLPSQPAPTSNVSRTTVGQAGGRQAGVPPALPRMVYRSRNPEDFPMCPIHKCRNRPGEAQVIFWHADLERYRCYKGHYFT